jgi:hypothetical protein
MVPSPPLPRPSSAVPLCVPLRLVSVREINGRRALCTDERASEKKKDEKCDGYFIPSPVLFFIKESLAVDFTEFYLFALLHFWRGFLSAEPARGSRRLKC